MAVKVSFVRVGGTGTVSHRHIRHEVAPTRHVEVFFLALFVPVADLAGTVKGEARPAIRSEEANLFSRKQSGAVNNITQG